MFAVFGRAIYVANGDSVRVLVDHRSPRGPLHLRVRKLPSLQVEDEVLLTAGLAEFPGGCVRIEDPWVGEQPLRGLARLDPRQSDIAELAVRVGGRGPGLTPQGDDVLAGVLLARWGVCDDTERRELLAIALSVDTNRISRAFLAAAAGGQCIEPAHDLLVALLVGDEPAAGRAQAELTSYGATSGVALARGIRAEVANDGLHFLTVLG